MTGRIDGAVIRKVGGVEYRLRLLPSGIADLQDEFGQDFLRMLDVPDETLPPMRLILRIVERALPRGTEGPAGVADEILADDMGVFGEIIRAAFPAAPEAPPEAGAEGNGQAAG